MRMKMKSRQSNLRSGEGQKARMMEGGRGPRGGHFGGGRGSGHGRGHPGGAFAGGWGEELGEGGGRGGRRGGRGRMFASGELRLLLLKLVADESRHGYELIKAIEELTGGQYAPSPGVVYPTLSLLVDEAAIEQQAETGSRKAFVVTEAGLAELAEKAEAAEALLARLRSLADSEERHSSPPIRRAVSNLFAALRNRANAADFEKETFHQIIDIIDDAARRIERL